MRTKQTSNRLRNNLLRRTARLTKQIGIALLLSAVCLLLTACARTNIRADDNPTVAWEEFCGYLSDGDYRAAIELTDNRLEVGKDDTDDSVEGLMLTTVAESLRAAVIMEPKINGSSAWQSVRLHHLDLALVMQKAIDGIMRETADEEWRHGSYRDDEAIDNAVKDSLCRQLDGDLSDCMVTDVIKVEFRYSDGRWRPVMSSALYSAITGNAAGASGCAERFFREYDARKTSGTRQATG